MGLYVFSMRGCTGNFAEMTPEAIGENGAPFFPAEMLNAMISAGRDGVFPANPAYQSPRHDLISCGRLRWH